ncbi:thiosulfate:glutathione sulfurtransferase-like isoform X2 [Tubulanus polymorphus]|uniref:thiosulfate:glutathione sulfurtransferase-like isoform X2 n=1 Tax=Tubulanus polymorphus TaxID=672921 RepID=UPI003DA45763
MFRVFFQSGQRQCFKLGGRLLITSAPARQCHRAAAAAVTTVTTTARGSTSGSRCTPFPAPVLVPFTPRVLSFPAPRRDMQVRGYSDHPTSELEYEDIMALIESKDIQLFDVREPSEVKETGMIKLATNLPLGKLKDSLRLSESSFLHRFGVPKPAIHDKNLIFYGQGPIKSKAALELAAKVGYKKARHYAGGWDDWSKRQGR